MPPVKKLTIEDEEYRLPPSDQRMRAILSTSDVQGVKNHKMDSLKCGTLFHVEDDWYGKATLKFG